jgi:iron(III) transport system ATP-binding protein
LRAETRAAVAAALAAAGATAILVTHDQPEALSMGTQVAVLRTGRLIQAGSPRDLYAHPADAALARFLGEAVSMRGTAGDGHVRCHLGSLRLAAGMPEGAVDVLIRPEQIRIAATQIHGAIPARVETVTFYGHDASIGLSLEDHPEIRITSRVAGYLAPRIRDQVWITIEGDVVAYPGS